ncbi:hypothetical protein CAPN001_11320 [Capnocytophaga stomatis]|uniref:hypothetical protein n=1 Tax=Capnocytophaga stomatis TaxID=1848904 RepID=UPI00194FA02A|nr:hypothetical protein [Capnocytophaga stomatis]GIJ96563.1 hypothetical protein CAPN001_11320 [Capnocytophaga stomatis]
MRKFIIQFFALDYAVFMFNRRVTWTRSANVIFPLMTLNGLLALKENVPLELSLFAFILLALAIFFGFIYFDIKPLKDSDYDYFDDVQKFTWDVREGKHPLDTAYQSFSTDKHLFVIPMSVLAFVLLFCLM